MNLIEVWTLVGQLLGSPVPADAGDIGLCTEIDGATARVIATSPGSFSAAAFHIDYSGANIIACTPHPQQFYSGTPDLEACGDENPNAPQDDADWSDCEPDCVITDTTWGTFANDGDIYFVLLMELGVNVPVSAGDVLVEFTLDDEPDTFRVVQRYACAEWFDTTVVALGAVDVLGPICPVARPGDLRDWLDTLDLPQETYWQWVPGPGTRPYGGTEVDDAVGEG